MTRQTMAGTVLIGLLAAFCSFAVIAWAEEAAKEPVVEDGTLVKVHYTLTVEGEVMDSSREGQPINFEVGGGQVIPGFDKAIRGMKVGEKKSFEVGPEEGYGPVDPEAIQELPRETLPPDITPEAGMALYARGAGGKVIPVKIEEVKENVVVLNFIHPLAGKTLNFDVEILEITPKP